MTIDSIPRSGETAGLRSRHGQRGAALIEAAISIPLLLLVAVGTFEFGRAYQTYQVLTNAAREGARIAVLPGATEVGVTERVQTYLEGGALSDVEASVVSVNFGATLDVNGATVSASLVTVDYPFQFMVLQPVAQLVQPGAAAGSPFMMRTTALMRNEAQ